MSLDSATLSERLLAFALEKGVQVLFLIVIWAVFPLLIHAAQRVIRTRLGRVQAPRDLEYAVVTFLTYTKYFIATLIVLSIFGLSGVVGTALASVGFVGLALGLAAQTVASNMVSGVFLLLDDDISIGDRIKLGEVEGVIEHIRLRTTRVALDNGTVAIVPNKKMVDEVVYNRSLLQPNPPPTPVATPSEAVSSARPPSA